ncbi:ribosome hibernation-promoting factor, HPF/YfiA family [Miniphocaeibacter massiliensis]|uniref:ribosome hibernation-promoting factor, HPF/YfiA family n=1 Tax=Miniphocaeibacter massiliensis TaxID=2041841 RepID=UPI000C1B9680|nr:ribosome-associated translation inhibitor RaiA [Miniphocaeibacter massiliensis]
MKLKHIGKNYNVNENLKEVAEKKLGRLDKYFKEDVEAKVTYSQEKNLRKVEVTIFLSGTVLRAEESTDDMYTSIDRVVDALVSQVRKYKTKLQKRYQSGETIRFENIPEIEEKEDEDAPKIVKVKSFGIKPMSVEEAILQMELVGHNFYVFLDAETDLVKVVYKRKDGNYGLLEPAF